MNFRQQGWIPPQENQQANQSPTKIQRAQRQKVARENTTSSRIGCFVSIAFAAWIAAGFISTEFLIILSVLYLLVLIVLLFRLTIQAVKKPRSKATAQKTTAAVCNEDALVFPYEYDGKTMAYQYEDVGVYVPHTSEIAGIKKGQTAILESEPENEYDPSAVAVYTKSAIHSGRMTRIGYLYRGALQRMANDWLERDEPIFVQFSYVNMNAAIPDKDGVKINIVFYE